METWAALSKWTWRSIAIAVLELSKGLLPVVPSGQAGIQQAEAGAGQLTKRSRPFGEWFANLSEHPSGLFGELRGEVQR